MNIIKSCLSRLLSVRIKNNGKNNVIKISPKAYLRKVKIKIYGDNNYIEINNGTYLHNVYIRIGFPDCYADNTSLKIGENTTFNSADIQLGEDNSLIHIGNDCMFSFNVELCCSDTHAVLNNNEEISNIGKSIIIGNHCWICKNAKILKNTAIGNNNIVAQDSIITKEFKDSNQILGGNPAKILKENINWSRKRPNSFIPKRR